MTMDCHEELKQLDSIKRYVDALNRHFNPNASSLRGVVNQTPADNLKAQLQSLREMSSDVLKLYGEGISNLKKIELHPKMQVDGNRYLIDIYYKEEQMNKFKDSLV